MYKKLVKLVYKKHTGEMEKHLGGTDFWLDTSLLDKENKVFYDLNSKNIVMAYSLRNKP